MRFLDDVRSKINSSSSPLAAEVKKLFTELETQAADPSAFIKYLRDEVKLGQVESNGGRGGEAWNFRQQHDTGEFLSKLCEELGVKTFDFQRTTVTSRKECHVQCQGKETMTSDRARELIIHVTEPASLQKLIDSTLQDQEIADVTCGSCDSVGGKQSLKYDSTPDVLAIRLSRVAEQACVTVCKMVTLKNSPYTLCGVAVKTGGQKAGHWYGLFKVNNEWRMFDDKDECSYVIDIDSKLAFTAGGESDVAQSFYFRRTEVCPFFPLFFLSIAAQPFL